ncbi:MAG TPA: hypothetical protein VI216_00970 [Candidatus Acidoferrales bacterium]
MRISGFHLFAAILLCATSALAQAHGLGPKDTFAAARLSAKEVHEITDGVEQSAYDTPDSWESELRVKRIDLGYVSGIVVQGTKLLCGGTGNCQTWVFRKAEGKWVSMFGGDQAPMADSFQFGPTSTGGVKDFTITANSSAEAGHRVTYKFDGKLYRAK